jgi:hypothetical protein
MQEFGTVSPAVVGTSMVQVRRCADIHRVGVSTCVGMQENLAHFHGSERMKQAYSTRYRGCFYVQTREWKTAVVHRGVRIMSEAIAFLSLPGPI